LEQTKPDRVTFVASKKMGKDWLGVYGRTTVFEYVFPAAVSI
jgi:hypothetical protein